MGRHHELRSSQGQVCGPHEPPGGRHGARAGAERQGHSAKACASSETGGKEPGPVGPRLWPRWATGQSRPFISELGQHGEGRGPRGVVPASSPSVPRGLLRNTCSRPHPEGEAGRLLPDVPWKSPRELCPWSPHTESPASCLGPPAEPGES